MSAAPRRAIALVGATATGKTAVSEWLADQVRGGIVCADARQIYRELEVGTGKPTPAERAARPHALFDLLSLGEPASAGQWARAAASAIEGYLSEGLVPILVGGSGLYVSALQRGLHPEPPKDDALRSRLLAEWVSEGAESMHARLAALDPEAAASLRARDRQRVIRALEIITVSGHTLAWWRERPLEPPIELDWRTFELTCPPARLATRITQRTLEMWRAGLLEETRALLESGKAAPLRTLAAIGYDEALAMLDGTLALEGARERMEMRTRQLAKRQRTWFRHQVEAERLEVAETDSVASLGARIRASC